MMEPELEINLIAEYQKYLRGCSELGWPAVDLPDFWRDYYDYRLAKDLLDALKQKQLPWVKGAEAFKLRYRWTRTTKRFKHLQDAVSAGSRAGGDDGCAGAGATAPILLGPRSRPGSVRQDLPREVDGETAA